MYACILTHIYYAVYVYYYTGKRLFVYSKLILIYNIYIHYPLYIHLHYSLTTYTLPTTYTLLTIHYPLHYTIHYTLLTHIYIMYTHSHPSIHTGLTSCASRTPSTGTKTSAGTASRWARLEYMHVYDVYVYYSNMHA